MNISILQCSAPFLIDEKVFPPLGLMAVGTALVDKGHSISFGHTVVDSTYFALGPTTPEYGDAVRLLTEIRRRHAKAKVVIGGPHATTNAVECLADGFDVVAMGDGENITSDTFHANGVVDLGRKPLDSYPTISRCIVDIRSYKYTIDSKPATTILTSRGCPYNCGFCSKTDSKVRFRGLESIEAELDYLKDGWGYEAVMIFDDTFIANPRRASQICRALAKRRMAWRCFVRGDLVVGGGKELASLMASTGCVEVGIGIETGSDSILRTINKGESIDTIKTAIGILRNAGIRVKGFFIIGLPGESPETLIATERFLADTTLDDVDFTVYQPYRGSPIWDNREDYDISWKPIPTNKRFYKGRSGEYQCAVRTSALTEDDIVNARDRLERTFKR